MHSEIENLINMALADGKVTEKEREIILRKAEALSEDKDEVEMILDGKIAVMEKEQNPTHTISKSNKEGEIKKCPSCGEVLDSFLSKCPSCGFEIRGKDANKIISDIERKIEGVKSDYKDRIAKATKRVDRDYLQIVQQYDAIGDVISNIPVPSTKEDLIEVISYCYPKRYDIHNAEAYKAKYKECLSKLEMLAINDQSLVQIIEIYKGKVNQESKKATLIIILSIVGIITIAGLCIIAFKYF